MKVELLKTLLSRLSTRSFESFLVEFFNDDAVEPFKCLDKAEEGLFYQPNKYSYGGTLHTVFVLQYLPLELCANYKNIEIVADPTLVPKLDRIRTLYEGEVGYFGMVTPFLYEQPKLQAMSFLTNLSGVPREEYDEMMKGYDELLKTRGISVQGLFLGSYDSFIELSHRKVEDIFQNFLTTYQEGISISLTDSEPLVTGFSGEKVLVSGVSRVSRSPLESLIVDADRQVNKFLAELRSLISNESREAILEEFLAAHYRDIFGPQYNRIQTQLWLRFPEYDIIGKKRRLDIFLRNSVINDWELFELKRVIPLTGTYRDVPIIAKEVAGAVYQTKNYKRILSQDSVKRRLAQEGIEYFEPSFNLVVGRTPQITHAQWRWLMANHDKDVRLLTYDQLLRETEERLKDRLQFLSELSQEHDKTRS